MNVGRFREVLNLYRRNAEGDTTDQYGRVVRHWAFAERVRGSAADVSSKDFYEAASHQLQHTVTFDTRWKPDIDSEWRILWMGSAWEIDQVNHLGYRGDFVRIKAHRIEPDGASVYEGGE